MEITPEVPNILKCIKCSELLSCGPVYFLPLTQNVICGRCDSESGNDNSNPDLISEETEVRKVRYIHYEVAASLLQFPCRYKKLGCTEKMHFSADGPNPHENSCKFKPYNCPMSPNGSCGWKNTLDKFLEHSKVIHPQQVFENPCCYPPIWNKSSERVFLITYMDHLFLLHVKVCLQSQKIFHSVRLLGDPALACGFQFVFKAKRNSIEYIKKGSILPAGNLLMEERSAITTPINNLLEMLDNNFERSVFTITISVLMVNCKFCKAEIEFSLRKICPKCLLKLRKCSISKDCTYEDVNKYKCYKHEYYYCKFRTKCSFSFCSKTFLPGNFFQHFGNSACRQVVSSKIGQFWHVSQSNKFCILESNLGPILCKYSIIFSTLHLFAYTSLVSNELDFYQFVIKVEDYSYGHMDTKIATAVHNDQFDWYVMINLKDFRSWKKFGVKIQIEINFLNKN